jgi:ATP-binding cassette, subfamily B, bacterial
MKLADLIDPFQPAPGPPPSTLWRFIHWSLSGAWPVLLSATVISALAGVMEVMAALVLGAVIDAAATRLGSGRLLRRELAAAAGLCRFLHVLRPLAFGASSAANTIVIAAQRQRAGAVAAQPLDAGPAGRPSSTTTSPAASRRSRSRRPAR